MGARVKWWYKSPQGAQVMWLYESIRGARGVLVGWWYNWYWSLVATPSAILGSFVDDVAVVYVPWLKCRGRHTVAVSCPCLVQTPYHLLTQQDICTTYRISLCYNQGVYKKERKNKSGARGDRGVHQINII